MINLQFDDECIILNIEDEKTGKAICIDVLDAVKKCWKQADEYEVYDIEYVDASVYGNYVAFCVTVAQGQGGIVFVWDMKKSEIVHYSNGEFALRSFLHNDRVYVLREVSYWGCPWHLEVDYCPFGTKSETEEVIDVEVIEGEKLSADKPSKYCLIFENDDKVRITLR